MFPYSLTSPNPWYITQEQLTSLSPSVADGISLAAQTLLRAETADFISQMGQQCKITQLAIATGSVYLHVFFTRFSFSRFDRFEVAATCLFLAGKVEERRTRVDQVINAYYHVRLNPPTTTASSCSSSPASSLSSAIHLLPPSPTSPEYEALRNRIYSLEFVVLDAIEFQFELTHPYTNLMVFLRETILGPKYANKRQYTFTLCGWVIRILALHLVVLIQCRVLFLCVHSREAHSQRDEREGRIGADSVAVH